MFKDRLTISVSMVLFGILLPGCRQSVEQPLNVAYAAPQIPADLDQWFTPAPNQKAFELLRDGETRIDLHSYYLGMHRAGWKRALSEFEARRAREFNTAIDVRENISAMQIGCDAFWLGYDEAWNQIKIATNNQGLSRRTGE